MMSACNSKKAPLAAACTTFAAGHLVACSSSSSTRSCKRAWWAGSHTAYTALAPPIDFLPKPKAWNFSLAISLKKRKSFRPESSELQQAFPLNAAGCCHNPKKYIYCPVVTASLQPRNRVCAVVSVRSRHAGCARAFRDLRPGQHLQATRALIEPMQASQRPDAAARGVRAGRQGWPSEELGSLL